VSRQKKDQAYYDLTGKPSEFARDYSAPSTGLRGTPSIPTHVKSDPVARSAWRKIVRDLDEQGKLVRADASMIELYACVYSRHRAALDHIRKHGAFEVGLDGCSKESAASRLASKLSTQLRGLLQTLGVAPTSRERVKPAKPNPKDVPVMPGSIQDLMNREAAGEFNEPEQTDAANEPEQIDTEAIFNE